MFVLYSCSGTILWTLIWLDKRMSGRWSAWREREGRIAAAASDNGMAWLIFWYFIVVFFGFSHFQMNEWTKCALLCDHSSHSSDMARLGAQHHDDQTSGMFSALSIVTTQLYLFIYYIYTCPSIHSWRWIIVFCCSEEIKTFTMQNISIKPRNARSPTIDERWLYSFVESSAEGWEERRIRAKKEEEEEEAPERVEVRRLRCRVRMCNSSSKNFTIRI